MDIDTYVMGVDPGKHTGIYVIEVPYGQAPVPAAFDTVEEDEVVDTVTKWHHEYRPVVVVEKFVLREGMHGVDLSPERINGRLAQWAKDHAVDVHWNLPVQKEFATNDVLRRLGLWAKGTSNRHAMDAARHAVHHLVKMRHRPTLAKAFPE